MILLFLFRIFSIDSILNCPELESAHYGICIFSLDNDSFVYTRNANKVLTPASNMKLVTTAAGLYFLGADFRYKTRLAIRGSIKGEKLAGDVLLVGGGDPLFGLNDIEQFVLKIKGMGIKKLNGDIIVIDDYFTFDRLPMGWSWHYLDARYAPEISGLSLNRNCVAVKIRGANSSEYAEVNIFPKTDYVQLVNRMYVDEKDSIIIYRKPEANVIYVEGKVKKGNARDIDVAVKDPDLFAGVYFQERLNAQGIESSGRVKRGSLLNSQEENPEILIDSVISKPLIEMINEINTESENLYAEVLLKTLGAEIYKEGSFNKGIQVLKDFLFICGVDTDKIYISDGSGLSRYNLISPQDLIKVLKFMYHSPLYLIYYTSLATPGKGTLESRFNGFKDTLRAKTGAINTISALSGYLRTGGNDYAFSFIFNNFTCSQKKITKIQEKILQSFSEYLKFKDKGAKN